MATRLAAAWYPKFIYFISRAFLVLHVSAKDIGVGYPILEVSGKGAGSYLAGMAVAIPILNVDGRRHTNNFSKNI